MRIGQYRFPEINNPTSGVRIQNGKILALSDTVSDIPYNFPDGLDSILNLPDWNTRIAKAVEGVSDDDAGVFHAKDVQIAEPISNPTKIVGIGLNYLDHAEETNNQVPKEPLIFSIFPSAINAPGNNVIWDTSLTNKVDYEAELVAVIGNKARDVSSDEAQNYIAGYTVGNDISARDLQHGDGQWTRGKSLDTFAPIGPEIVTGEDIEDPQDLDISTKVNGEAVQSSNTSNMIFGVDEILSFCSRAFTLNPGDLIFTGTPAGVGYKRDPPILLQDGDEVVVEIGNIGSLVNHCKNI